MKIAVYGATGRAGSTIVAEASHRGHDVVALSRHEPAEPLAGASWQHGDLADPASVQQVAGTVDAVVTANGPSRVPGENPDDFATLIRGVAGAVGSTRLIVVGGAGSLLDGSGERLVDGPEFPDGYRAEARASAAALEWLRGTDGSLDWTYVSPAPVIDFGDRTGSYWVADDTPAGSFISFEDYAVALVDELERPAHRRARFTVATS